MSEQYRRLTFYMNVGASFTSSVPAAEAEQLLKQWRERVHGTPSAADVVTIEGDPSFHIALAQVAVISDETEVSQ